MAADAGRRQRSIVGTGAGVALHALQGRVEAGERE